MPVLKLPNDLARELADIGRPCATLTEDDPEHGWTPHAHGITEVVENRDTHDNGRWESVHELVIRTKDGALWHALYQRGLTENQDVSPFEYDGPEIEFTQVKPIPVSHIEYQAV